MTATAIQFPRDLLATPEQFGATGDGVVDDTSAVTSAVAKAAVLFRPVRFDKVYKVTSTVEVSGDNQRVEFGPSGQLTYETATLTPLRISGDNCAIDGGTITAPATFDATNAQPAYAVVHVTGDNCSLNGLKIQNVPKCGVYFQDVNGGSVVGCVIRGGTTQAIFTGTETGHSGILIDTPSTSPEGDFVLSACQISNCVQGVLFGNFGAASDEQGAAITGCSFRECWNHGVYASSNAAGITVSGNTFTRCQASIALTGNNHTVGSNAIQTLESGTGADQTGISLRNPVGCVIDGNTIKGEIADGSAAMTLTTVASGFDISKNIVSDNVVDIASGAGAALKLSTSTGQVVDNTITGNYFRAPGSSFAGIVSLSSTATALGYRVANNTVVHTGVGYGISVSSSDHGIFSDNTVRLEVDSGSATVLGGISLTSTTNTTVSGNKIYNTADWGTSTTYRAIWEQTGSASNYFAGNQIKFDTTKLTAGVAYFMLSGSGTLVHGSGDAAPSITAAPGSTWSNTSGGTGTSFYKKESASNSATWVGL